MLKRDRMVDYHAYIRVNDIGVRLQRDALRLSIDLSNISARPIDSVTFSLRARNGQGDLLPVNGEETHIFTVSSIGLEAAMRMVTEYRCDVPGTPSVIETEIEKVVFSDGTVGLKQKPHKKFYYYNTFDPDKPKEAEIRAYLRKYSDKAICFAEKRTDGWLCSCGRLNRNQEDRCPECLSDRKEIFFHCTLEAIRREMKRDKAWPFRFR